MLKKRPLVVYPNPFHQLDEHGRAVCAVRLDPAKSISGGARRWIAASLKLDLVEERPIGEGRQSIYDRTFAFKLDAPTEIPDTAYHRARIASGELIAADEKTAASCGIKQAEFVEPLTMLESERKAALDRWSAEGHDEADAECAADDVSTLVAAQKDEATKAEDEAKKAADAKAAPEPKPALVKTIKASPTPSAE